VQGWRIGCASISAVIPAERSESRDPYPPTTPMLPVLADMDPGSRRLRGSPGM